jgi:hypothetical protein
VSKRRKQRKAAKRLVKLFREAVDQAVCAALDAWLDRPFAGPEIRSIGGDAEPPNWIAKLKTAVKAFRAFVASGGVLLPKDISGARLESQTAEDLLRQALEPARKEKPEPHRAGLPPERLRKVWAEWDVQERGGPADLPLEFSQDGRLCRWADGKEWFAVIEASAIWDGRTFRPHGATWSRVEAMADEAEKPTLLDLTKLPPGTVCEALGVIQRASMPSIIVAAGELFRIHKSDAVRDEMAMIESYSTSGLGYWVPALVPARVVKEGGEDAPR